MPVPQFDINFNNLSAADFVTTLSNFADLLVGHSFFKNNWPDYLTHPLQLKEQLKAYELAANAALIDGGRKNLQERDDLREGAQKSAIFMSQYVVMRSHSESDPSLLNSVGLKVKKRPKRARKKYAGLDAPSDPSAKHGTVTGTALISFKPVKDAGSYEIQICDGDPEVEASWRSGGQFKTCRNNVIAGLEPTRRIFFRVRCHGAGAPGPFSKYVSLIIL